jgi:hypothetical protein
MVYEAKCVVDHTPHSANPMSYRHDMLIPAMTWFLKLKAVDFINLFMPETSGLV